MLNDGSRQRFADAAKGHDAQLLRNVVGTEGHVGAEFLVRGLVGDPLSWATIEWTLHSICSSTPETQR